MHTQEREQAELPNSNQKVLRSRWSESPISHCSHVSAIRNLPRLTLQGPWMSRVESPFAPTAPASGDARHRPEVHPLEAQEGQASPARSWGPMSSSRPKFCRGTCH